MDNIIGLLIGICFYGAITAVFWKDMGTALRNVLLCICCIVIMMTVFAPSQTNLGEGKMIENKEVWSICLGLSIFLCGTVKAFFVARNPYWSGKRLSELNQFESSKNFVVRFIYDFIGGLLNLPYLLCIVLPVAFVMYGFERVFME